MPMKKVKKYSYANENGLTLVEVLASIVILSIILVSILMILLQSMKAKQISEVIIDATYIAQTEMEKMYELSGQLKASKRDEWFANEKYYHSSVLDDKEVLWEVYRKDADIYDIEVWWTDTDEQMTRIIVKVYDKSSTSKPQAQMENLLEWKADDIEETIP